MTMRIAEKDTFIHYVLLMLVCGLIMTMTSGCAGLELGGKFSEHSAILSRQSVTCCPQGVLKSQQPGRLKRTLSS